MENLFSGRYIFPVLIALFFSCSATGTLGQTPAKRDVTCIIAADLHFDFLPETDQYYHRGDESGTGTFGHAFRGNYPEDRCRHFGWRPF